VDDHLGVALSREPVSECFELAAQRSEVVNLSVEDNPRGLILVGHGLSPGGEIDDAQAAHPERSPAVDEDAFIVWATMTDRRAHVPKQLAPLAGVAEWRRARRLYETGDAAHDWVVPDSR